MLTLQLQKTKRVKEMYRARKGHHYKKVKAGLNHRNIIFNEHNIVVDNKIFFLFNRDRKLCRIYRKCNLCGRMSDLSKSKTNPSINGWCSKCRYKQKLERKKIYEPELTEKKHYHFTQKCDGRGYRRSAESLEHEYTTEKEVNSIINHSIKIMTQIINNDCRKMNDENFAMLKQTCISSISDLRSIPKLIKGSQ